MLVGLGLLLVLGSGRQTDDAGNESKKFGWKGKLARAVFFVKRVWDFVSVHLWSAKRRVAREKPESMGG